MTRPDPRRLESHAETARTWLFDAAFPLWWERGADRLRGGFHERLSLDGAPLDDVRRVRVAARQVYSFGLAHELGWTGPWREAMLHGLAFLTGPGGRPDGTIAHRITVDGRIVDEGPDLYDQAFWLLALAHAHGALGDAAFRDLGHRVLDLVRGHFGHPERGFEEARPRKLPLRSNPHMHLLEAALAWMKVDGDPRWRDLAGEIVSLLRDRFIDPRTGALLEFFDGDWRAMDGEAGDVLEPGHHFEWAWLLTRWSEASGEDMRATAQRLVEIGETQGIDRSRGVAMDEIRADFSPRTPTARLWPQTERLKAALSGLGPDPDAAAAESIAALGRYLDMSPNGLWRDRMLEDGGFADEPAPASTLYHLACAHAELIEASRRSPPAT